MQYSILFDEKRREIERLDRMLLGLLLAITAAVLVLAAIYVAKAGSLRQERDALAEDNQVLSDLYYGRTPSGYTSAQTQRLAELQDSLEEERLVRVVRELNRDVEEQFARRVVKTVRAEANRARVDALLVIARIRAESNFNPRAISVADARGLMQVMPDHVGRLPCAKSTDDLYDVECSIAMGIDIWAEYLRRAGGDVWLAECRYGGESTCHGNYHDLIQRWYERTEQIYRRTA